MNSQAPGPAPRWLMGVDFSCAPDARKPITVAWGERRGAVLRLERLDALPSLDAFEALVAPTHERAAEGWLGGFDFPFGLPRVFVDALVAHRLPEAAPGAGQAACDALVRALHAHCTDRQGFQALIDGWGTQWGTGTRPDKLPHRAADVALPGTQSTSPLQTRYVPVGKMFFEGLPRLVRADFTLPGQRLGQRPAHIALEAWPGLLAAQVIGRQRSYKSETDATPERLLARMDLIDALEQGRTPWGLRLKLRPAQRDHLVQDPKGDRVDAVLCLMQAAWAHVQAEAGDTRWGLPVDLDPVEGWITGAAP